MCTQNLAQFNGFVVVVIATASGHLFEVWNAEWSDAVNVHGWCSVAVGDDVDCVAAGHLTVHVARLSLLLVLPVLSTWAGKETSRCLCPLVHLPVGSYLMVVYHGQIFIISRQFAWTLAHWCSICIVYVSLLLLTCWFGVIMQWLLVLCITSVGIVGSRCKL